MMLGKTLMNLDEFARALDPDFNPPAALREQLSSVLQRRVVDSLSPATMFGALIETKDLAERLPGRLNRILDRLADSDLRFRLDGIDQTRLMMPSRSFSRCPSRTTDYMGLRAPPKPPASAPPAEPPSRSSGHPPLRRGCQR
jgi:hypothetical protein